VRLFSLATGLPILVAAGLLALLLYDVITDSISWQVIQPNNSGVSFAFTDGFRFGDTWERVVTLDLQEQGMSQEQIDATLRDAEARRIYGARNRVELMLWAEGKPLRYVVTSSRDRHLTDVTLAEGFGRRAEIEGALEPGQLFVLNPWLDIAFFSKNASRTATMAGLGPALVGSIMIILLVIALSVPLGVGTAVYLEEYAPDTVLTRAIELNLSNLAGVPSVVYGILGLSVFVRGIGLGPVVLAGALTLSLLVVPVVVIAAREAIRAVPGTLRQAAYGLGATKSQVVAKVVLPNAIAGITTGVVLAVARALGETAPLLLVGAAAFVPRLPDGLLSIFTALPIQIYAWVSENDVEFTHVASAAIAVLLAILFVLYALAFWLRRRFGRVA
jgi:phosphate transport system permease protein